MLRGFVPWPGDLAARYRRDGYWIGESLADLVRSPAEVDGDRIALVAGERQLSYRQLDVWADRFAAGLHSRGLRSGDRAVVQLPNIPEFAVAVLALFRLGVVPVFALAAHRRSEITHLCATTGARLYVAPDQQQGFDFRTLSAELQSAVPSLQHVVIVGDAGPFVAMREVDADPVALPRPDPGDVAFFLLSGGTTGMPKLIPRTHDDYAYQLRATAGALGVDEHSTYLAALPVAHNAALGCPGLLGTLRAGGKVVLLPSPSPDDVFPAVHRWGATLTTAMPPIVSLWMDAADVFDTDLSGVVLQVGGAMLSPGVAAEVGPRLGAVLTHWFGMAEGFLSFTRLSDPEHVAHTTQGRPLCPADEFRIVDEVDRDVPPGDVGELLVRGPYTLQGYYDAPEDNARAFSADGFLRTGDLAQVTPEGRLVIAGRLKDVVNRGGEKVSAVEVEDHLRAHPDVVDTAVVAVVDDVLGEKTCAWVVTRSGTVELEELHAFLTERGVAGFKLPDALEVVASLPRSPVGKIDKKELRRLAERSRAAAT